MKLGFVSAILPELSLEEVLFFAADEGFDCVEIMCWPKGRASRRYAGITHIDVGNFKAADAKKINQLCKETGVSISALGYYPNPLTPNVKEARIYVEHIRKMIKAASLLGINRVNSFVGRDWTKNVDDNWSRFLRTWKPIIRYAEKQGVKVGIENCPMHFTNDEWPAGKNLATTPAIWKRMWKDIPSRNFGLNYDPSHLVWQFMDYIEPIKNHSNKFFHVHAKDARVDYDRLNQVGTMANPNEYHTPKLPGMGDVDWGKFFGALTDARYKGAVCVEIEDRAYEKTLRDRQAALRQSYNYLRQFVPERD